MSSTRKTAGSTSAGSPIADGTAGPRQAGSASQGGGSSSSPSSLKRPRPAEQEQQQEGQQQGRRIGMNSDEEAVAAVMMRMHDKERSPAAPPGVPDPLQLLGGGRSGGPGNSNSSGAPTSNGHRHQQQQQQQQQQNERDGSHGIKSTSMAALSVQSRTEELLLQSQSQNRNQPTTTSSSMMTMMVGNGNQQQQHQQQRSNLIRRSGSASGGGSSASRGGIFDDAEEQQQHGHGKKEDALGSYQYGHVHSHSNNKNNDGNGRPSTAPARLIGLSIQTTSNGSANARSNGGVGGVELGHVSSFDNDSVTSPRSNASSSSRRASVDEVGATAMATSTTAAAAANGMAPLLTAPSKLEGGSHKSYDSSDDDLSRVLVFGGGVGSEDSEDGSDADVSSSSISRGGANEEQASETAAPTDAHTKANTADAAVEECEKGGLRDRGRGDQDEDGTKSTNDTSSLDDPTKSAIIQRTSSATSRSASQTPTKGNLLLQASAARRQVEPSSEPPRSSKLRFSVPALANSVLNTASAGTAATATGPLALATCTANTSDPTSGTTTSALASASFSAAVPDGEEVFAIERILGRRYNASKRRVEYLIVWKGFADKPDENTWEPPEHLSIPSLNFVQRRWGDSKPSRTAAIEMTDSDLDEERVRAFFEWEKTKSQEQAAAAAAAAATKKKKAATSKRKKAGTGGRRGSSGSGGAGRGSKKNMGVSAVLEDGETTLTFGDGMADPKSFVKQTLLELVRKVRSKVDAYGFFSKPVDPITSQAPDYYDVIDREKEAMCLDLIELKIKSGTLMTVDAFEAHLQRIVHCCRKYNTNPNNFVRLEADKIEERAAPMIDVARRAINRRLSSLSAFAALSVQPQEKGGEEDSSEDTRLKEVKKSGSTSNANGVGNNRKRRRSKVVNDDDDDSDDDDDHDDNNDTNTGGRRRSRPKSKRSRRSKACSPTPGRRTSARRIPTSGKKGFADADAGSSGGSGNIGDATAKRPTRATRKSVDYSENSGRKTSSSSSGGDDESYSDSISVASRSSISTNKASNRPKLDRNKYRDPAIPGSEVPPCRKDLSTSDVTQCIGRKEWLSLVPEMMNVCNEAARRATLDVDPDAERYEKPLSDVYMTERLEYDAVVTGYTCHTKAAPHYLQGFVVVTDFQVFRKSFRWTTSEEPSAGITPSNIRLRATDITGSLTADLQKVKTRGARGRDGIVFDRVAEVALLGGLRCGGKLLERALIELRQSRSYDFVVLQATKIAIPFYERMGFVRVGAVCRFNDNPTLPEVSYRHWSEIVDNEAMEASYMMALRLQDFEGGGKKKKPPAAAAPSDSSSNGIIANSSSISTDERRAEASSALRSACALLSDAAVLRALGTTASVHSLREMLATANDFAKCAGDKEMMKTIKRATNQCDPRFKRIGEAKMILREELDLPIGNGGSGKISATAAAGAAAAAAAASSTTTTTGAKRSTSVTSSNSSLSDGECARLAEMHRSGTIENNDDDDDEEEEEEYSDVKVSVTVDGTAIPPSRRNEEELQAHVSNSSGVPLREIAVSIRMGGSSYEPEDEEEGHALLARLRLCEERKNCSELKSATAISLQCLRDTLRDGDFLHKEEACQVPPVRPGDFCMIRVLAKDGSLMWLPAQVRRHCKDYELPTDTTDASTHNSFIVKTVEAETVEEFSVCLDPASRGVGRMWCTNTDWYSFQVMPPAILDALLIGSCVDYPLESGVRREGFIASRVGTGLQGDVPRWKLVTYDDDDDDEEGVREHSFEYTAAALKEAVTISDHNLQKSAAVIHTLPPMAFDDGGSSSSDLGVDDDDDNVVAKSTPRASSANGRRSAGALAGVNEEDLAEWIQHRLEKCKLVEDEAAGPPKKKRRRR